MITKHVLGLTCLAGAASVALFAQSARASGSDDFDRAALGARWTSTAGHLAIQGDQLVGQTSSLGYLASSSNDIAGSEVLFLNGTGLQYGALALGDIAGGNNIFVKLQEQNGDGMFEYGAFYTGNNGGGDFFALTTPVPSPAVISVTYCGGAATLRITSAAGVQTYSYNYGSSGTTFGSGGGAGTYGSISIDNFITNRAYCTLSPSAVPVSTLRHAVDLSQAH